MSGFVSGLNGESATLGNPGQRRLSAIWALLTPRRRRQLQLTMALMLIGALAELLTIGAVLPFLAIIADRADAARQPLVGTVIGWLGGAGAADLVWRAAALLVAMAVLGAIVRLLLSWATYKFVFRVGHDLGTAIYARMLRQPYGFYVTRNSSEVVAGVEKVQSVIFSVLLPLMQGVVAGVIALFIIVALFFINPFVALISAAFMIVLYAVVSLATGNILRRNSRLVSEMQTERIKQVQEGLGGIRDILLDQSQYVYEASFRHLDNDLRNAQSLNGFIGAAPRFVVESAGIVLIAFVALYMNAQPGGVLAALPMLGALALGAQRLLPLLQLVYFAWSQYAGTSHLLDDVVALTNAPVISGRLRDLRHPVPAFRKDVRFDSVTFGYGDQPPILDRVDLLISKGERVGLLGSTGSGKSTLLDLLMGLLDPGGGRVLVDGRPVNDDNRADWQAQIAHVPQVIYLSDSTIAANIAFGEAVGEIDHDRVREAAERAQIRSFIDALPQGFGTIVGERGVRLSGGQRQRIGIARALYKRAPLLILDEATSALDDATEEAVINAISASGRDITIIMIAHRLSSLRTCDRLFRIEAAKVIADVSLDATTGKTAALSRRTSGRWQ